MLGKTGEAYSQDIIELGLTLMAAQLTAPQAVSVMRAFIRAEYPEKKEGADFRIPDANRFREWRRYLEPISHYIGVSVLKLSIKSHLLHDATTKNHIHVYHTCFRCELEGEDGKPIVVDVPLKFEICPDGSAAPEADLSVEAMTGCTVAERPAVSMVKVVSSSSDGAARATSREFGERKEKELTEVQRLVDEDIANCPDRYLEAVSAYRSLTDEQRDVADEFHELGCSGHALNLIVDDSWKQSEKKALRSNMARHRAAMIIERFFVSGYVRRVAKASGKAGRKAMVSGPLKRLWENNSAAVFWELGFSGQRSKALHVPNDRLAIKKLPSSFINFLS